MPRANITHVTRKYKAGEGVLDSQTDVCLQVSVKTYTFSGHLEYTTWEILLALTLHQVHECALLVLIQLIK